MKIRNELKFIFFTFSFLCVACCAVVSKIQKSGNFHILIPNVAYRSGQLGREDFEDKLSASRLIPTTELLNILEIIKQAPKPILIHCHGGADRTGLVSAITKLALEMTTIPEAKNELSLQYGHFPYFLWNFARAMDENFN